MQFKHMLCSQPDIIQLDKFSPEQVKQASICLITTHQNIKLSVAGSINKHNVADYAKLEIDLFIASAPYYVSPEDIKVIIEKQ